MKVVPAGPSDAALPAASRVGRAGAFSPADAPADGAPLLHGLGPVVGPAPRVLILGSFPGAASLAQSRYYAHPRNQFWPILAALLDEPLPDLVYPQRLARLQARGIALWDVVGACRRRGSLDASIREACANDFTGLLDAAPQIGAVAFNGAAAAAAEPVFAARGLATYRMPSSSPAHAALSFEAKLARWRALRDDGWLAP